MKPSKLKWLVVATLWVNVNISIAQVDSSATIALDNAMYVEFLGQGMGISGNYERLLSSKTSLRLGYTDIFTKGFPVGFQYFSGSHHKFELGAGIMIDIKNYKGIYPTALIGYRFQSETGYLLRVGITPVIGHPEAPIVIGGLSVGRLF